MLLFYRRSGSDIPRAMENSPIHRSGLSIQHAGCCVLSCLTLIHRSGLGMQHAGCCVLNCLTLYFITCLSSEGQKASSSVWPYGVIYVFRADALSVVILFSEVENGSFFTLSLIYRTFRTRKNLKFQFFDFFLIFFVHKMINSLYTASGMLYTQPAAVYRRTFHRARNIRSAAAIEQ